MKAAKKGLLIVMSGPSGVGKSSIRKALFEKVNNFVFSVSATTRAPRNGEKHGVDYYFISEKDFKAKLENQEFLEWNYFVGNYYGTLFEEVERLRRTGKNVMVEIDVNGALMARNALTDAIYIFIAPPTKADLISRLKQRGTETDQRISERIEKAKNEFKFADKYDYIVINSEISKTVEILQAIVLAEECRSERSFKSYIDAIQKEK